MATNVGLAIKAAIERGHEHQRLCPRKLQLRFMIQWGGDTELTTTGASVFGSSGLLIRASIAARTDSELVAQGNIGQGGIGQGGANERMVPWEHLDARALELVGLVDECVAGVYAIFGIKAAD